MAVSPFFRPRNGKRFGAIYRPNRNPSIDRWIKESRLSINIDVFSRDSALWKSKDYLKEGNWLALLFDQHSGIQGCHSEFLNRFASMTTMPDLFAKTARAETVFVFPRRLGFFKAGLEITHIGQSSVPISYKAHKILEQEIRKSEGLPEWLWSHERWKTQQNPRFHLMHRHKREFFPESIPKTTKIWIRMPNWLGDVVMALPLVHAIFKSRPDAKITLLAKSQFEGLFSFLDLGYKFIPTPSWDAISEVRDFLSNRREYPSMIINFANSFRSDMESFLTGAPARYGLTLPKRCRPLLSDSYSLKNQCGLNSGETHQTKVWENMLKHFGLSVCPSYESLKAKTKRNTVRIGVFAGSANSPEKRWPLNNWINLLKKIINLEQNIDIILLGSKNDSDTSINIKEGVGSPEIIDKTGKTTIQELCEEISNCSLLVGNDSGGIHLGNCLNVPAVVIFGPTNPKKTCPIYNSRLEICKLAFDESEKLVNDVMDIVTKNINVKYV